MQKATYQDVDVSGAQTSGLQERAEQRGSCGVAPATPHENEMRSKNTADIRKMCVQTEGQLDDVDDRVGVDESLTKNNTWTSWKSSRRTRACNRECRAAVAVSRRVFAASDRVCVRAR